MADYTMLDFIHIVLLFLTCVVVYISGKNQGASEMCEMLLHEKIINNKDLDKLRKRLDK